MKVKILIFTIMSLNFLSCRSYEKLDVVQNFDLDKYSGKWYEISRLPNTFEKSLDGISATYTPIENNKIEVYNSGFLNSNHKVKKDIKGKAWIPNINEPAKLKVQFFFPFSAKYWVIYVDEEYKYAIVGHPNRNYLWILSRDKNMPNQIYENMLNIAKTKGFNVENIIKVNQSIQ